MISCEIQNTIESKIYKIKSKSNSSKEKFKKSLSSKKNVNVMGEDNE
jgi:hypothetical protein